MIIDTSALIAVITGEEERKQFLTAMGEADCCRMAAPTYLELGIVVDGRGLPRLSRRVDALLEAHQVSIVDFTAEHAEAAREAYRRFGKGSGHRARLNFGDCIAYAVATVEGEPLLFKGQDFTHTDVRNALTEGE